MGMILNEHGYPIEGSSFQYGYETVSPSCQRVMGCPPSASNFKGASRIDMSDWNPPDYSTNDTITYENKILISRIKDLWRNCEIVRGSVNQFVDYAVGNHFRLEPTPCWELLGWDETESCEWADLVEKQWRLDTESKNNWIHAGGEMTFTELVQSVVRHVRIFGENFCVLYYMDRPDNRPFRTAVGFVDPSRVFTPLDKLDDDSIVAGINRSNFGYPQGYYIHDKHPSEMCRTYYESEQDKYIYVQKRNELGREQVIHSHIKELPNQGRGVSPYASSIQRLKLLEKFELATIQTAILQASVAATIESDYPDVGNMFDASPEPEAPKTYCDHYMQQSGAYHNELKFNFEGSSVARLWNGEEFKLHSANLKTADFDRFSKTMLMHTARALGTSVHHLTQDFSDLNYSGARAEMLSTWKNIQTNRYSIAEDFAQRVYCAWLEDNIASGRIKLPNESNPDKAWLYYVNNRDALSDSTWYGSIKDEIDRKSQIAAYEAEFRMGVLDKKTYAAEVHNKDWRETERALIKEEVWINKERIANGLEPFTADEFRAKRQLVGSESLSETIVPDNQAQPGQPRTPDNQAQPDESQGVN